ncbi:MAG: carbohydrate ABC transporter permease [Thermoprotei archaeon]|nr:MAG: carbohydrate ABC transporter permease [Thermoprotei archaeon]
MTPKHRYLIKISLIYSILILFSIIWLMPFYIALVTSLKSHRETYVTNVLQPPSSPRIEAWIEAWSRLARPFFNSLLISVVSTFLCVIIGMMAGYYLVRFNFRGAQALFFSIAVATFIPYQILLIPITQLISYLNLMRSYLGLILTYTLLFSPWAALISSSFFLTIPKEFEEAAFVDGAGILETFLRVIIPISLPGIISTTIIIFMGIWNEFLFAVTLSMDPAIRPIQPEVANLRGTTTVAWNVLMAGSIIAALPPILISMILGKYFIKGLLAGALKR